LHGQSWALNIGQTSTLINSLYQTRHTAATLWLAAGENPEWIARQMGHNTTEMLFRVYSRFVPNLTRKDGSAFEALLSRTFENDNI
jgi:integrase